MYADRVLPPDDWLEPPSVMSLLAVHLPLRLLFDLASMRATPLPAVAYEWGPGRGRLWVSPWALDPIP